MRWLQTSERASCRNTEMADAVTYDDLAAECLAALDGVVDAPEVETRWILEAVSGYGRGTWRLHSSEPATQRQVAWFDAIIQGRREGRPLQYLIGSWSFRSLDLFVDERVLIPRPETERLVDLVLEVIAERSTPTVVDLGTGSGAIALSVATEHERAVVWATDVSRDALSVARANLAGLGRPAERVTYCEGSWFAALPPEMAGRIDVVVSNPPYIPDGAVLPSEVERWEPSTALRSGRDGLDALRTVIAHAPAWLRPDGWLMCEIGEDQGDAVTMCAQHAGFQFSEIVTDLVGRPRFLRAAVSDIEAPCSL